MPLDFPTSPTDGQEYNGYVYSTSVGAWQAKPAAQSPFYTSDTPPSNPVAGDSWFNTNDGTMYIYVNDGNTSQWVEHRSQIARSQVGLVPIVPTSIVVSSGSASVGTNGTVSFTNSNNISLNGVFTSSYKNYRLVVECAAVTTTGIGIRYRTSGTDNSSNLYYQYWTMKRVTGASQDNTGGPATAYNLISATTGTTWMSWSGDVFNPQNSSMRTVANGLGYGNDSTSSYALTSAILFDGLASFDGISLLTNGITGTVKIYGYN